MNENTPDKHDENTADTAKSGEIYQRSREEREADFEWLAARASRWLEYNRHTRAHVAADAYELGFRLNGRGFAVSLHDVARIFRVSVPEVKAAQAEKSA